MKYRTLSSRDDSNLTSPKLIAKNYLTQSVLQNNKLFNSF